MSEVAAGWYPDPEDGTHDRYWNGVSWTAHRHPRPQGPPGPLGPPPPGVAYGAAPATPGSAITALVLGIIAVTFLGLLTGIPAMVVARSATREIDASGGRLGGRGLASAGFWTGLVGTAWSVLALVLVFGVFTFGSSVTTHTQTCAIDGTTGQQTCR